MQFAIALVMIAPFVALYAYVFYPLSLRLLAAAGVRRTVEGAVGDDHDWPSITLTIPAYNEAAQIDELLQSILSLDYPRDRMQVLVISDASDDGTDEIVGRYADRGVELFRMPVRGGKSAAENAARPLLRGDIIVNTDASIRIEPKAVKALASRFRDPTVGLASGRDISVSRVEGKSNAGESAYVGYEMWVRKLETDVSGIVGASGCFYAIRRELHDAEVPPGLSRDFAAALVTRENGYRAVTVNEAVCRVPRAPSLRNEYRRKVRTIARGMATLHFKRNLLNPFRFGIFAWMLFSHKVCRWAAPWAAVLSLVGLAILAPAEPLALAMVAGGGLVGILGYAGWRWPDGSRPPRVVSIPAFLLAGNIAVLHAGLTVLRGERHAIWEPTRRDAVETKPPHGHEALVDGP